MSLSPILELFGPISVIFLLSILGFLSQRLGAVTKHPPVYRWLFVSAGLVSVGLVSHVMLLLTGNSSFAIGYDLLLALGLTLGAITAWRYWSWLLSEDQ